MRLIDADALQRALADMWYDGEIISVISVSQLIEEQPTVNANESCEEARTPIVYRHITKNSIRFSYNCRMCLRDIDKGQNYCPTCGTRIAWKEGKK